MFLGSVVATMIPSNDVWRAIKEKTDVTEKVRNIRKIVVVYQFPEV